jgi:LPXTG-motif cell wall-anchored protein
MPSAKTRLASVLTAAVLLIAPAAATAQSAGDEQYADPLGNTQGGGGGNGGSGNQGNSGSTQGSGTSGSGTTAPSQGSTAPGTTSQAPSTGSGATLPRTGADAGLLALAGALMLGTGLAMRRRLAGSRS